MAKEFLFIVRLGDLIKFSLVEFSSLGVLFFSCQITIKTINVDLVGCVFENTYMSFLMVSMLTTGVVVFD